MSLPALILGGARCVWDDVERLERLIGRPWPGIVIAANDVGVAWHRRLDHWASLHPASWWKPAPHWPVDETRGWLEQREALGRNVDVRLWAQSTPRGHAGEVSEVEGEWWTGSTGLLAVGVAYTLGIPPAMLCGVPMDDSGWFLESLIHTPEEKWKDARVYRDVWKLHAQIYGSGLRSMSGQTAELLGGPDDEWIEQIL